MSPLATWVASREPAPPAPLAAALRTALPEGGADSAAGGADPSGALGGLARARLELALARPGRDRESAYRLLEADALLTYACEAALDETDCARALERLLAVASRSR